MKQARALSLFLSRSGEQAGLGDYTCQPSSLAILWNNLKCPKTIVWMQGSEHGYVPPEYEGRDTFRSQGVDAPAR